MNSQKIGVDSVGSSPSDQIKPEKQKDQQVNAAKVMSCDPTEMQQLKIILKQRVSNYFKAPKKYIGIYNGTN